ncbi:MAG: Mu-like prophage major head subunit gpT family protein [Planctomycetaceae bacterium]|nr:Mu-like prophage major head subunit gpT family protein [Planctomycetaceae bacterium]
MEMLTMRSVIARFFNRLEAYLGKGYVNMISMYFESDQPYEDYYWLGATPAVREWKGERLAKGLREAGLRIENKEFEDTLKFKRRDFMRDKSGQTLIRIDELAMRAAEHWSILLSALIAAGTGSTLGVCYDGQYFFDTDHAEGSSGIQKNLLTNAEVAQLDVTTATAPTASEVVDALMGVIAYMLTYKDDQGQLCNAGAHKFLVQTTPYLMGPFAKALGSQFVSTGASVVDNVLGNLKIDGESFEIGLSINPRLTWTTQFAVFRTDAATKPFIRQEEQGVNAQALGEGSEHAFKNKEYLFGIDFARNVGYGMWQQAALATFS